MARESIAYTGPRQLDVLQKIAVDIDTYVDWYAEDGMYLPEEFEKDPAGWTQTLRTMQAAFGLLVSVGSGPWTAEEATLMYDGIEKYHTYSRHLFL